MALIALAGGLAAPMATPVAAAGDAFAGDIRSALVETAAEPEVAAFYAARGDRPLWFVDGRPRREADDLLRLLKGVQADGLDPAAFDADALQAALARARSGHDLVRTELAFSRAAAAYGQALHQPTQGAGLVYTDAALPPPTLSRRDVLERLASAPTLAEGLASIRRMNPIYDGLRAALAVERAQGGPNVALIRANLERARALPADPGRRYILVDVTAQRLAAYENGTPALGMKVVVGKPDQPTPGLAALVRFAVFRPYWNVPPDLVAHSVAPKVLAQGVDHFRRQRLEALSDWSAKAQPLDPTTIDWADVAAGGRLLRVRQLPGRDNMMGQVKFMFPNELGVYLHDSPLRALFAGDERLGSSGCVRLEDAPRLARWLLGDAKVDEGLRPGPPETPVTMPEPVPVYLIYFTAMPADGGLSVRRDIYGRDASLIAALVPQRLASR